MERTYNNQEKKFQTPEESLHWISYNLKKICEELKKLNDKIGTKEEKSDNFPF